MNKEIDVRHVLPVIRVPTLLMHRSGDPVVPLGVGALHGRAHSGRSRSRCQATDILQPARRPQPRTSEIERFLTACGSRAGGTRPSLTACWRRCSSPTSSARPSEPSHSATGPGVSCSSGTTSSCAESCTLPREGDGHRRRRLLRLLRRPGPRDPLRLRCSRERAELGLEVRAGLHTGECELVDGKVAGIAVHIGARVAAQAQAGEVLVSSTVKDLVAGSGIAFDDRGIHELKGIPGRVAPLRRNAVIDPAGMWASANRLRHLRREASWLPQRFAMTPERGGRLYEHGGGSRLLEDTGTLLSVIGERGSDVCDRNPCNRRSEGVLGGCTGPAASRRGRRSTRSARTRTARGPFACGSPDRLTSLKALSKEAQAT